MKVKKKRSVAWKLITSMLIVALVIGASYLVYYLVNYTFNNAYKDYVVGTTYREGKEFKAQTDSGKPDGLSDAFVLAAESDSLKLYLNEKTTETAIYDKINDRITYSNPQDITEDDYANLTYFKDMKSQIKIGYYKTITSDNIDTMTSYEYCTNIKKNNSSESEEPAEPQFKFESLYDENGKANGLRVIYSIGDLSNVNGTVPEYITIDTFEDLCDKITAYDKENGTKKLKDFKNKYAKSKNKKGFYQRNAGIKKMGIRQIQAVLELVGWTAEDCEREMEASGEEYVLPVSFTIPLEYTLIGDKLQTNVVTDHIVEVGGASISYVEILPFFGAVYHQVENEGEFSVYVQELDGVATSSNAKEATWAVSKKIKLNEDNTKLVVSDDFVEDAYNYTISVYKTAIDEETEEVVKGELVGNIISALNQKDITIAPKNDYIFSVKKIDQNGSEEYDIRVSVRAVTSGVKGYYFVPNGSGSLINFNSINCDDASDYSEHIYGVDEVMADAEMSIQETTSVKLPVYGWSSDNGTIFVILTRGESLVDLKVQTANDKTCKESTSLCNYNSARCRYTLRVKNDVVMSSVDSFSTWNKKVFDTELTQLYCFLKDDEGGYSGMANYYRNYLEENGQLVKSDVTNESNIGLYLDLIGAVKGDSSFLGVTYEAVIPVTTFDQAKHIIKTYNKNNVNNIVVNYQGWMNDGYYHNTVKDIDVISKLGGKSGFEDFCKYVEKNGGKVYGDMAISRVSFSAEDFRYNQESSRFYGSGHVATYGKTSPTTYSNAASLGYEGNLYNIVSPKFYPKYIESALDEMNDINTSGVSFRDFGTYLNSDMKKTNLIHREESKEITIGLLDKFNKKYKKDIMFNAALSYAFPYADDIINAPIGDNNYIYVDTEVPFYEMVIHGYINYSGNPINLSADTTSSRNILECIEYGACPHFTFTYESAAKMKYTALNNMYATNYKNWLDESLAIYTDVNNGLSMVTSASVSNHEILDPGTYKVRKVTYDNGVTFIVNYSDSEFNYNGLVIPANDWKIEK